MKEFTIYDMLYPKYKITKPIRLIEFFAGYGSQALALKYLGVDFEHYKISEWAIKSIQAYKDLHFTDIEKDYTQDMTKQDLIDYFKEHNISSNYNDPLNEEQIKRLNENQLRKIYNNMKITNNLGSIVNIKGKDLEIINTDKYEYIITYSFPCQDLSNAGKKGGMSDTSTRSGMLWEVERILNECNEIKQLPQILLMENVPQVHSEDVLKDFNKWKYKLEELGYKNYFQDLIATDYGIPQTRNRCFMVSILGDYSYTFPSKIPLKLKLKDLLEDNVNEKYYLSDKMINCFINPSESGKNYGRDKQFLRNLENNEIASTITTAAGNRPTDNFIYENHGHRLVMKKVNEMCDDLIKNGKVKQNDTLLTNFISRRIKENDIVQNNDISPTLTTSATEVGVCVKENYIQWKEKGMLEMACRAYYENKVALTITTTPHSKVLLSDLRIRRLTEKECFRLMGVKDEDFEKCSKNQSSSNLYHLAGDSIVVNVLMAIFKEML